MRWLSHAGIDRFTPLESPSSRERTKSREEEMSQEKRRRDAFMVGYTI